MKCFPGGLSLEGVTDIYMTHSIKLLVQSCACRVAEPGSEAQGGLSPRPVSSLLLRGPFPPAQASQTLGWLLEASQTCWSNNTETCVQVPQ